MASPRILGTTIADRVDAIIAAYAPTRYHLCLKAYFIKRNATLIHRPPRSGLPGSNDSPSPTPALNPGLRTASAMISIAGTTISSSSVVRAAARASVLAARSDQNFSTASLPSWVREHTTARLSAGSCRRSTKPLATRRAIIVVADGISTPSRPAMPLMRRGPSAR